MRISPIDIQQKQFKTRPFGYEKAGVDQFLEVLAEELERLIRQNQDLREELARTTATLHEMREREETLKTTLVTTQRVTEELKATARREVDVMMAEAELKAERLMYSAEERRQQLIDEIQEIKRQKIDFEVSLRGLLEKHIRMLELNSVAIEQKNADARLIEESMPYAESPGQDASDESERDDESPEEVAGGSVSKVSSGAGGDSNLQELIFEFGPESASDDEAPQK
jgi:cell division initiation protein